MEERKMILKMIEEGKITADEGLALLEALGKKKDKKHHDGYEHSQEGAPKQLNKEQFQKIKEDLQEATDKIIGSANKGATKLLDLIGKAVDKLQNIDLDLDLDFSLGGGVKVSEIVQVQSFNPKDVHFSLANGSLRISPWEKDYAQIDVTGIVAKSKDEVEARHQLSEMLEHQYSDDKFSFFVKEKKGVRASLEVFLPIRVYQRLHVSSNNSSVRIGDFEIQEVKIESTNGSIRLHDLIGMNIEGRTSNGRIQLKHIEFKHCVFQTSNGGIHMKHAELDQGKLITTNGSVQTHGHLGNLLVETINGSIRIEQEHTTDSSIDAKTNNGAIRVAYPKHIEGVYGELYTRDGQIQNLIPHTRSNQEEGNPGQKSYHFEQGEQKVHHLKAETSTGSIQIVEREAD